MPVVSDDAKAPVSFVTLRTGGPSTRCHKPGDVNPQSKLLPFFQYKFQVLLYFGLEFAYRVILGTLLTVVLVACLEIQVFIGVFILQHTL